MNTRPRPRATVRTPAVRRPAATVRTERRLRAIRETRVPAICRNVRGLKLVREDEMEDGSYYLVVAPPGAGDNLNIQLDGNDMFVGPFGTPEDAQAAVGGEDGSVDVVDGDALPVGSAPAPAPAGGPDDLGGDDEFAGMPPVEARRKRQERLTRIRQRVRRSIMAEADAMLDVNTTVGNNDKGVEGDGSGNMDMAGAPPVAIQSPQDAGGSTELDIDTTANINGDGMKGAELLTTPNQGGADTGDDPDLSGAGDGKGGVAIENGYAIKRGSYVTIQDIKTGRKIDGGNVARVSQTEGFIEMVGGERHKLAEVIIQRRA